MHFMPVQKLTAYLSLDFYFYFFEKIFLDVIEKKIEKVN